MIDFHTQRIPSGLPELAPRAADPSWPVFDRATGQLAIWALARMGRVRDDEAQGMMRADPAGAFVDGLERAEAAWAREDTANILLALR